MASFLVGRVTVMLPVRPVVTVSSSSMSISSVSVRVVEMTVLVVMVVEPLVTVVGTVTFPEVLGLLLLEVLRLELVVLRELVVEGLEVVVLLLLLLEVEVEVLVKVEPEEVVVVVVTAEPEAAATKVARTMANLKFINVDGK